MSKTVSIAVVDNTNDIELNIDNTEAPSSFTPLNTGLFSEHQWLYQVQPFSYPEIQTFINRFYLVLDEWKSKREQGIEQFSDALINPQRSYLLTLARRPIFLTLMSLVHVNDTQMPYGRADLYKRIIDLYLMRQTLQRRIKANTAGKDIPQWDEREIRRALGYLAWRSQMAASEVKGANDETDKRQVIWSKADLKTELTTLLASDVGGRFDIITAAQADDLLAYFLHPAGLLIEPAEEQIQFSHLNFQEYLCAEYLHGRTTSKGSKRFIKEVKAQLFSQLAKPGWDEVGVLFFTIHATIGEQSETVAHFELLAALDASVAEQAKLLMTVYTSYELPFTSKQRLNWLPLAMVSCLVHPRLTLSEKLKDINNVSSDDSGIKAYGKALLLSLLAMGNTCAVIDELKKEAKQHYPEGFFEDEDELDTWFKPLTNRWKNPAHDKSWDIIDTKNFIKPTPKDFAKNDARQYSLLYFTSSSFWFSEKIGKTADECDVNFGYQFIVNDKSGQQAISTWLDSNNFSCSYEQEIVTPYTLSELDALLPVQGPLLNKYLTLIPAYYWLQQGETISFLSSKPSGAFNLSLKGIEDIPARTKLSIALYQVIILVEKMVNKVQFFTLVSESVLTSHSASRSASRSASSDASRSSSRYHSIFQSNFRSESRSLSVLVTESDSFFSSLLSKQLLNYSDNENLKLEINFFEEALKDNKIVKYSKQYNDSLSRLAVHYAARDWFSEQVEKIEQTQLRGGRVGEPLPQALGLFDDKGMPLEVQSRASIVALLDWVNNEEAILDFVFPDANTLSKEDEKILRSDLAILKQQSWALQNIVQTVLNDWPEDQATKDFSTTLCEQDFIDECNRLLFEAE